MMRSLKKWMMGVAIAAGCASAQGAILFGVEEFNYADGNLDGAAPAPTWGIHSGTPSQTIVSNRVFISDGSGGDHNVRFTNTSTGTLYAGVNATVDPNDLPTSLAADTNAYFFHLSDLGAGVAPTLGTGFRGRVWAVPGTVAGKFRFGLSTTSGVATTFSGDLDPGVDFRLVVSYDFAAKNSQLWINPASDLALPDLTGTPEASAIAGLGAVVLRSGNVNQGDVFVDNVVVADTFAEARAVPEPGTFALLAGAALLGLRRRRA